MVSKTMNLRETGGASHSGETLVYRMILHKGLNSLISGKSEIMIDLRRASIPIL